MSDYLSHLTELQDMQKRVNAAATENATLRAELDAMRHDRNLWQEHAEGWEECPSIAEAARYRSALNQILAADGWEQAYDIARATLASIEPKATAEEGKGCQHEGPLTKEGWCQKCCVYHLTPVYDATPDTKPQKGAGEWVQCTVCAGAAYLEKEEDGWYECSHCSGSGKEFISRATPPEEPK